MIDALKSGIADYMNKHLAALVEPEALAAAGLDGLGIVSIEVAKLSTLECSIRVRTRRGGVRYFSNRVSEPI